jgi:hypothetical protein
MKASARRKLITKLVIAAMPFLWAATAIAQHDSLIMKNGNVIVGEIKSLERGVLVMNTSYSNNDFSIEWSQVNEIYSSEQFLIRLNDGRSLNGNIHYLKNKKKIVITSPNGFTTVVGIDQVVFVREVKSDFWGRMKAGLDLGMTIAKANELRQYSIHSSVSYMAKNWQMDAHYNFITSRQDSATTTERTDAAISFKYYLQHGWFTLTSLNFLSNTEQALALRATGRMGAGKLLFHTNQRYWGIGSGLSFNRERFTNETKKRSSLELFVGSELNLFDMGDFNLLSSVYIFPSLTEEGRWRSDIKMNMKYDLPLDFYIKPGITINYDNRPAIAGRDWDYVFMFTVGWEL